MKRIQLRGFATHDAVSIATIWVVLLAVALVFFSAATAYLPPQNPSWPPTYNVTESLITMQCNSSGFSNISRALEFGIVSYDWSNAKKEWARSKPMDCEEKLNEQARKLYGARNNNNNNNNNSTNMHIFAYRNIVKALPWFSTVREKLVDPQYRGFFLRFSHSTNNKHSVPKCAAEDPDKCSNLYHDQEQTPQVPTCNQPNPDGACDDFCDCGPNLPCGEYYFDHRNGTMLREWLVKEVVMGALITDNNNQFIVDGLFLDDYWCSDALCKDSHNSIQGCPCNDPHQGPTESHPDATHDMGLSDEDIRQITLEWNTTMKLLEQNLLQRGAYTWWLMEGQENANAMPYVLDLKDAKDASRDSHHNRCVAILQDACRMDSSWQNSPRLFGFSVGKNHTLPNFDLEWAFFLLVRGPYSWAGWGEWGMTWPFAREPAHGELPPLPHGVPLPRMLQPQYQADYGVPLGVCYETPKPGVFRRDWSNGWIVEIDCCQQHDNGDSDDCQRFGIQHSIKRVEDSLEAQIVETIYS